MVAEDSRPPASEHTAREGMLALTNGLKLATSTLLTWAVALIVTFKPQHYLGPDRYGHYQIGETWAMVLAVFLTLGVDTYISREIAVRPRHASDFFGGLLLTRAVVVLPLVVIAFVALRGEVYERQLATVLFALAYIFTTLNQTFQQILQAASKVGRLAVANVLSKVLWGGGTFVAIAFNAPFWVLPLPLVVSEAMKSGFLFVAVRDAVELKLRVDVAATKKVLTIAFPFFVANIAVALGSAIDLPLLGKLVSNASEIGWYGAARQIARLSALLSPVMSGVLIPMMSRAKARDEEEFYRILRRGFEAVNVVSLPLTLMLALGAEFWIHITIRDRFLPAADSLRWLAPTFVFAYSNVLLWLALMILGRSGTITLVSIAGLVLLPVLIVLAVPLTAGRGPGGAGMGVAMALSLRELIITIAFLVCLKDKALDRRGAIATLKSLGICAIVAALHVALERLGPARLAIDAALYGVLAIVLRVVRPTDAIAVFRMARGGKKARS